MDVKYKKKSASTIRSRLNRSKRNKIDRPDRHLPNARAAKLAELTQKYGLPPESKFLFLKKGRVFGKPRLSLEYGTVVCLDADTCDLLLVVRFVERNNASDAVFDSYNHSISTIYQHAKARNEVKTNGATYRGRRSSRKFGRMYAAGFRPGYDPEVKGGHYTWNQATSADLRKMEADLKRQGNLPEIESFMAERFSGLSLHAFESNASIAARTNAPSWASESFYVSPNAKVFGSNIVVTCDQFVNKKHKDKDCSKYVFGLFGLVDRASGRLYQRGKTAPRGTIMGGRFVLNDYNVDVNLEASDGVIEMIWNSQVHHQTTASKTFNADAMQVAPEDAEITRFGCACQISQALVNRLDNVKALRSEMSEEDWVTHQSSVLTGYKEQAHKKMKALALKLGIWQDDF
ncbi:uncharacterized protein MELLADRAFT_92839 [Melampsora larici-populina 98AG31]|uniref:Tet-like 2OG-Fe(II) oxygenase domain-containing protein n=1 Tax=Melampsora larici-populina (strain 98AG31 / pathotype 3-4-7) TaxID=747676 RepID=F4S2Z1_MELLP|nr:uncharacterized protein MELLADRAFT_92839 [Melampsora larici-populina 98AG31]EGG00995.1 hypothetical protein MELLADRAFT_92839 [Melampsora larici-populina 98AG31]